MDVTHLPERLADLLDTLPVDLHRYVTVRVGTAPQLAVPHPMGPCAGCSEEVLGGPHEFDIEREYVAGEVLIKLFHHPCNPSGPVDFDEER